MTFFWNSTTVSSSVGVRSWSNAARPARPAYGLATTLCSSSIRNIPPAYGSTAFGCRWMRKNSVSVDPGRIFFFQVGDPLFLVVNPSGRTTGSMTSWKIGLVSFALGGGDGCTRGSLMPARTIGPDDESGMDAEDGGRIRG